jgi:hypothetical protein
LRRTASSTNTANMVGGGGLEGASPLQTTPNIIVDEGRRWIGGHPGGAPADQTIGRIPGVGVLDGEGYWQLESA